MLEVVKGELTISMHARAWPPTPRIVQAMWRWNEV
jgi:hypothetical protein